MKTIGGSGLSRSSILLRNKRGYDSALVYRSYVADTEPEPQPENDIDSTSDSSNGVLFTIETLLPFTVRVQFPLDATLSILYTLLAKLLSRPNE